MPQSLHVLVKGSSLGWHAGTTTWRTIRSSPVSDSATPAQARGCAFRNTCAAFGMASSAHHRPVQGYNTTNLSTTVVFAPSHAPAGER